jgi:hypothetical protein
MLVQVEQPLHPGLPQSSVQFNSENQRRQHSILLGLLGRWALGRMTRDLQTLHVHCSASRSSMVQFRRTPAVASQISFLPLNRKNNMLTASVIFSVAHKTKSLCSLLIGSASIGYHRLPHVQSVRRFVFARFIIGQLSACSPLSCCT